MKRARKVKTARNSRRSTVGFVRHETLEPPCKLTAPARKEYDRLVAVLKAKGTLDRMDLACVAECARVAVLLDAAYGSIKGEPTWEQAKLIGLLDGKHRGRLRDLGLTTQPCRSVVRANPTGSAYDDEPGPWAKKLKVS
jgi:phage terminase small subunit